jgi:hypothetical protein
MASSFDSPTLALAAERTNIFAAAGRVQELNDGDSQPELPPNVFDSAVDSTAQAPPSVSADGRSLARSLCERCHSAATGRSARGWGCLLGIVAAMTVLAVLAFGSEGRSDHGRPPALGLPAAPAMTTPHTPAGMTRPRSDRERSARPHTDRRWRRSRHRPGPIAPASQRSVRLERPLSPTAASPALRAPALPAPVPARAPPEFM